MIHHIKLLFLLCLLGIAPSSVAQGSSRTGKPTISISSSYNIGVICRWEENICTDSVVNIPFLQPVFDALQDFAQNDLSVPSSVLWIPVSLDGAGAADAGKRIAKHNIRHLVGASTAAMLATKIAELNSAVHFSLLDPPASPYPEILANRTESIVFREDAAGFLAGVLAGAHSKTHRVSAILGPALVALRNFGNGFRSGVKGVCPTCAVSTVYLGSFRDTITATNQITGEIARGSDVVFAAAGAAGSGAIAATAGINETFVIGVDSDAFYSSFANGTLPLSDAAKNSPTFNSSGNLSAGQNASRYLLSSAVKRADIGAVDSVTRSIETLAAGTSFSGTRIVGLLNNGIALSPCHDSCAAYSSKTTNVIPAATTALKRGSLDTGVNPHTGAMAAAETYRPPQLLLSGSVATLPILRSPTVIPVKVGQALLLVDGGSWDALSWVDLTSFDAQRLPFTTTTSTPTSSSSIAGAVVGFAACGLTLNSGQDIALMVGGAFAPSSTLGGSASTSTSSLALQTMDVWVMAFPTNCLGKNNCYFDPALYQLSAGGSTPSARHGHTITHFNNTLYLFGGFDGSGAVLSDLWSLSGSFDDALAAASGESTSGGSDVQWTQLESGGEGRGYHTAVIRGEDSSSPTLLLVGGTRDVTASDRRWQPGSSTTTTEFPAQAIAAYDLVAGTWNTKMGKALQTTSSSLGATSTISDSSSTPLEESRKVFPWYLPTIFLSSTDHMLISSGGSKSNVTAYYFERDAFESLEAVKGRQQGAAAGSNFTAALAAASASSFATTPLPSFHIDHRSAMERNLLVALSNQPPGYSYTLYGHGSVVKAAGTPHHQFHIPQGGVRDSSALEASLMHLSRPVMGCASGSGLYLGALATYPCRSCPTGSGWVIAGGECVEECEGSSQGALCSDSGEDLLLPIVLAAIVLLLFFVPLIIWGLRAASTRSTQVNPPILSNKDCAVAVIMVPEMSDLWRDFPDQVAKGMKEYRKLLRTTAIRKGCYWAESQGLELGDAELVVSESADQLVQMVVEFVRECGRTPSLVLPDCQLLIPCAALDYHSMTSHESVPGSVIYDGEGVDCGTKLVEVAVNGHLNGSVSTDGSNNWNLQSPGVNELVPMAEVNLSERLLKLLDDELSKTSGALVDGMTNGGRDRTSVVPEEVVPDARGSESTEEYLRGLGLNPKSYESFSTQEILETEYLRCFLHHPAPTVNETVMLADLGSGNSSKNHLKKESGSPSGQEVVENTSVVEKESAGTFKSKATESSEHPLPRIDSRVKGGGGRESRGGESRGGGAPSGPVGPFTATEFEQLSAVHPLVVDQVLNKAECGAVLALYGETFNALLGALRTEERSQVTRLLYEQVRKHARRSLSGLSGPPLEKTNSSSAEMINTSGSFRMEEWQVDALNTFYTRILDAGHAARLWPPSPAPAPALPAHHHRDIAAKIPAIQNEDHAASGLDIQSSKSSDAVSASGAPTEESDEALKVVKASTRSPPQANDGTIWRGRMRAIVAYALKENVEVENLRAMVERTLDQSLKLASTSQIPSAVPSRQQSISATGTTLGLPHWSTTNNNNSGVGIQAGGREPRRSATHLLSANTFGMSSVSSIRSSRSSVTASAMMNLPNYDANAAIEEYVSNQASMHSRSISSRGLGSEGQPSIGFMLSTSSDYARLGRTTGGESSVSNLDGPLAIRPHVSLHSHASLHSHVSLSSPDNNEEVAPPREPEVDVEGNIIPEDDIA